MKQIKDAAFKMDNVAIGELKRFITSLIWQDATL